MRQKNSHIIIPTILFVASQLHAQEFKKMRFTGFISDFKTNKSIQYGAIKNTKTGEVELTNEKGSFTIVATVGDTLKFRCMGYKATEWIVPGIWTSMEDSIKLKVETNIYALNHIVV